MTGRVAGRLAMVDAAMESRDAPAAAVLLDLLERDRLLTPGEATRWVPVVWDQCGAPMLVLSVERWVALFRLAGYTHDFVPAPRPIEPLRLWRGSDAAGGLGMCWSSNIDVARWLAVRYVDGRVWSAVVEPGRLLAFVAPLYEDQYVLDTRGLVAELVEGPDVVAAVDVGELGARLDRVVDVASGGGGS